MGEKNIGHFCRSNKKNCKHFCLWFILITWIWCEFFTLTVFFGFVIQLECLCDKKVKFGMAKCTLLTAKQYLKTNQAQNNWQNHILIFFSMALFFLSLTLSIYLYLFVWYRHNIMHIFIECISYTMLDCRVHTSRFSGGVSNQGKIEKKQPQHWLEFGLFCYFFLFFCSVKHQN